MNQPDMPDLRPSSTATHVEVTADELPVHCPTAQNALWNSHPRVYIPLDESPEARCAYCGTVYRLVAEKGVAASGAASDSD